MNPNEPQPAPEESALTAMPTGGIQTTPETESDEEASRHSTCKISKLPAPVRKRILIPSGRGTAGGTRPANSGGYFVFTDPTR